MHVTMTAGLLLVSLALASASLAAKEEERSAAELLRALDSPQFAVRRDAVRAIQGRSEPALLDRLLRVAREDPHPNIRMFAAEVLATFEDGRVFDVLRTMAEGETSAGPRNAAYVGLGALGDPRGFTLLMRGLQIPSSRGYAARGLGRLGDRRAFEPLERLYRAHRDDPYVSGFVPPALLALDHERALPVLLGAFQDPAGKGRPELEQALAGAGGPRVRDAMLAHLGAEDPGLRAAAVRVLGTIGGEEVASKMVRLFEESPRDRAVVADALGELGARESVPVVARALVQESSPEVRRSLARALGRLGDAEAVDALVVALRRETDDLAKVRLLEALGCLGRDRAVAAIVPFLDDPGVTRQPARISSIWTFPWNVRVRSVAVWALRRILDGQAPRPLRDLSSFPEPPPTDWETHERAALLEWWKRSANDPRYGGR